MIYEQSNSLSVASELNAVCVAPAAKRAAGANCAVKPRILFVDDEAHVRDGMRRLLRSQRDEWSMDFVRSAGEALVHVVAGGVDTIVTDVMMPRMTGLELLAELQAGEETRTIPVIVVTGSADHDLKRRALDLGATDLLAKPVDREELLARLRSSLRLKSCHDQIKECNETLHQNVSARTAELAGSRIEMIWRLAQLAEFRDKDTGNHVVRVGHYSRVIAEALRLDRHFVEQLFLTSPLHDIGKISIPDSILRKPGKLNADEWAIMQQHCVLGAEILRRDITGTNRALDGQTSSPPWLELRGDNPLLAVAASIALTHHEHWDGAGYPGGLAGEEIPLESRIVAVADAYDALSSDRPYKTGLSHEQVVERLAESAGTHFDPDVYSAFVNAENAIRAIRAKFADTVPRFAFEDHAQ